MQIAANETEFDFPQSADHVEGQIDGLASGIMDLMDNPDPDSAGVAESIIDESEGEVLTPEEGETTETETPEVPEPEKYSIKWQGQEKEVTQDELINLAQQGFDYTAKTQALAQERDQLAPYIGLANTLKQRPDLAQQVADLLSGKQTAAPPKPEFDDPIEQLKWETKQEALAELRKEMQEVTVPMQRQQVLNQVRMQVQADPDYREIHQQIVEMVQAQPPALQRSVYQQLDQDPQAYMDAFQYFKNKKATTPTTAAPPAKIVKQETRAPILEAGKGIAPESGESKAKVERISKMKAKALRSGDPGELASWLTESGALDHLF